MVCIFNRVNAFVTVCLQLYHHHFIEKMQLPWRPLMAMACCVTLVVCFRHHLTSIRDSRSFRCPSVPSTRAAAAAAAKEEDMDRGIDGRSTEERYSSEESSLDARSNRWRDRSMLLEGVLHKLARHVDILETKRKHDSEARKVRCSVFIFIRDYRQVHSIVPCMI